MALPPEITKQLFCVIRDVLAKGGTREQAEAAAQEHVRLCGYTKQDLAAAYVVHHATKNL